jgi:hypothetical protein
MDATGPRMLTAALHQYQTKAALALQQQQQQQTKAALHGGNNNSTETSVSTTTTFASTAGSSKTNFSSSIATSVSLPVFVAADMTFAPAFDEANKQLRASCDSARLVRAKKYYAAVVLLQQITSNFRCFSGFVWGVPSLFPFVYFFVYPSPILLV